MPAKGQLIISVQFVFASPLSYLGADMSRMASSHRLFARVRTRATASLAYAPAFALVLIIQALLAGCSKPGGTGEENVEDAADTVAAVWGVKAPDAPNETLLRWAHGLGPWPVKSSGSLTRDTDEVVDLYEYSLTDEVRAKVSQLRRVHWLRLPIEAGPADLRWLGKIEQLRGISLAEADMTGADFQILSHLKAIQWLNLNYARMTADDFKTLPQLKSLQVLCLDGRFVTDEYLFHLAELRLPSLITLSLKYTNVTDAGLERICFVYELQNLNLLDSERVTKKSVESIARMGTLRELGIGGTGICPDYHMNDAIRELHRRLPQTRVDYGD